MATGVVDSKKDAGAVELATGAAGWVPQWGVQVAALEVAVVVPKEAGVGVLVVLLDEASACRGH